MLYGAMDRRFAAGGWEIYMLKVSEFFASSRYAAETSAEVL